MGQASRPFALKSCRISSRFLSRPGLTAAFCGVTEKRTLSPQSTWEGNTTSRGCARQFSKARNKSCLIILDDLLNDAYSRESDTYLQKAAITEVLAYY